MLHSTWHAISVFFGHLAAVHWQWLGLAAAGQLAKLAAVSTAWRNIVAAAYPKQRIRWRHRLPRAGPVDRHSALLDAAHARRVVHVGFVDELAASKLAQGVWLHSRLADAADSLVGLDADEEGVSWARGQEIGRAHV